MLKLYFDLTLLSLVPFILGQCTEQKAEAHFQRSVYEFSIKLSKRIAQETENHFVASTLSPWTLLTTLSLGATDNTLERLQRVLRLHTQKCFNYEVFGIIKNITSADDGAVLERSATIFVDNQFNVKESFVRKVYNTGVSDVKTIIFDDFADVAQEINDYVSNATHGSINEVLSPEDLNGIHVILIDALYFKGSWANKFPEEDTEESAFYGSDGKTQIGDVNLMFITAQAKLADIKVINAHVLELPYAGRKYSMLVFLPYPEVTIADVLNDLMRINLVSALNVLDYRGEDVVQIQLPRFKIASDLDNLKEYLIDMDLQEIFSSDAQFYKMSEYSLYVSNFVQKANIEVTEEGTEASAASAATMAFRSSPEVFNANRPFLYIIVDRQKKFPIFTGAYSKPTIY